MKQIKIANLGNQFEEDKKMPIKPIHNLHVHTIFKPLAKKLHRTIYVSDSKILVHRSIWDGFKSINPLSGISCYFSKKNPKHVRHLHIDLSFKTNMNSQEYQIFSKTIGKRFRFLTNLSISFEKDPTANLDRYLRSGISLNAISKFNNLVLSACHNLKHLSIDYHDMISQDELRGLCHLLCKKQKNMEKLRLNLEDCDKFSDNSRNLLLRKVTTSLKKLVDFSVYIPKLKENEFTEEESNNNDLETIPISKPFLQKLEHLFLHFNGANSKTDSDNITPIPPNPEFKTRFALTYKGDLNLRYDSTFQWLKKNFWNHASNLRLLSLRLRNIYQAQILRDEAGVIDLDALPRLEELHLTFDHSDNLLVNFLEALKCSPAHPLKKLDLKFSSYYSFTYNQVENLSPTSSQDQDEEEEKVVDEEDYEKRSFDSGNEAEETSIAFSFRTFCREFLSKLQSLTQFDIVLCDSLISKKFIGILNTAVLSLPQLKSYSMNLVSVPRFSDLGLEELQRLLRERTNQSLEELTIGLLYCKRITEKGAQEFKEALADCFSKETCVKVFFEENATDSEWDYEEERMNDFIEEEFQEEVPEGDQQVTEQEAQEELRKQILREEYVVYSEEEESLSSGDEEEDHDNDDMEEFDYQKEDVI